MPALPARRVALGLRLGLRLVGHVARLALFDDAHLALEALVFRVANLHAHVDYLAVAEVELVVGIGVGREPVLAVNLFPVSLERGEALLALGHALALDLDYLQVAVVNRYAPLKEALADLLRHHLRRNVEDESAELVNLLAADVGEVVLVYLRGFEREGLDAAQVFEVF